MMTARERFVRTLDFRSVDPPFVLCSGAWQETRDQWRTQGWDGRPLDEIFGTDVLLPVAVLYLAVAGIVVLLAGMGQMAWAAAIEVAKTSASISSLAVGAVLGFYLGYGPS